ncbi:MAG: SdrD B-like domain-containing protein [Chloroflexota bacterium]
MKVYRLTRALGAVLLLSVVLWSAPLSAQAACPGNVVPNPSFEEGFSTRGASQVNVANGWTPFWQDGPNQDAGYNRRPEFQAEDGARFGRDRIHEGNWGQKWFTVYGTHNAGVYQQINVPNGSVVRLSAWAQVWSSAKDNPKVSNDGAYNLYVGIDPTGGTNFAAPAVVWSAPSGTLDKWVELAVQARAQSGRVTVFLRGEAQFRLKHNDAYFDDVCVTYTAPTAAPTARPRPTNTPAPTATPPPAPTEAPTVVPASEPTATPTAVPTEVPATGRIRAIVFEDRNATGLREANEPLLSGARLELTTLDRKPLASGTTQGGEPVVFEGLAPGSYVVTAQTPLGYVPSSPNQWAVALLAGSEVEIAFGGQVAPTPTRAATATLAPRPAATPTLAPTPMPVPRTLGQSFRQVSGILVAMLALILPLAYRLLNPQA